MTLRTRLVLYLVVIHVMMAALAVFLFRETQWYLLVAEVVFAASLATGYRLVDSLFVPLRLIGTGAELIAEKDFASHFRAVGQPEMDALVTVYNDMIDRLREERLRLEEQSTLLERIIRASPSGILVCDLDGNVRQINPAAERLLGVPAGEIEGRPVSGSTHEGLRLLGELAKGESRVLSTRGLTRLRCQHGEFIDQGFPRSFYLVEEITEELRASERAAYEKLIRMISHEVRNSVGAVGSLLDSSLHYSPQLAPSDREDFDEAVRVARERLVNLDRFVGGFAEVVRLPEPDRRPTDLGDLLRDIGTLVRPELDARGIELNVDVPDSPIVASVDKNQFEQLLLNLVRNAWEAVQTTGTIRFSASLNGRSVRVAVQDTGPGLSPDVSEQIFTPFFTTKREGRGIGLTLVREIALQHGAELSFRNVPGGGAEFAVTLQR
jgi:nitrogen fixation/metabolism regulation signal transduction histidine kinase